MCPKNVFVEITHKLFLSSHLAMTSFTSDDLWRHVLYSAAEWVGSLFLQVNKEAEHHIRTEPIT